MADIIQIRRDTAANWTTTNPILAQGELGLEIDTDKFKSGDGVTAWNSLGYVIDTGNYSILGHTHDDRYFTETEANANFSATGHIHDDRYYTETEANARYAPITAFYTQTSLTIDGANGNFFLVSLSANESFSLSNIITGTQYFFRIYNSSGSAITITYPNTADIKSSLTFTVGASKYKEVAMIYDGANRTWQLSEELT